MGNGKKYLLRSIKNLSDAIIIIMTVWVILYEEAQYNKNQ
jgi:hypothetical protein